VVFNCITLFFKIALPGNACFLHHLVLSKRTRITPDIGEGLKQCLNLRHLTLYFTNTGTGPMEASKYIGEQITSLTLRIIWMPALDAEYASDLLPTFDQSAMSSWQLMEFAFRPIQQYSRVTTLRILIQPGLEYESSNLSELIKLNTRGLQLTSFYTNSIIDYTNTFIGMSDLRTVTFDSWQSKSGFTSSKPKSPKMCCHNVDYVLLRTLLQNDESRQWNYVFSGTHIILHAPKDDLHSPSLEWIELDLIKENLQQMDLALIVCYDLLYRSRFISMPREYPDVYLEFLQFHIPKVYRNLVVSRFVGAIAPTTHRLIVDTVVSGTSNPGKELYQFFTDAVAPRMRSSFQLQHLQNSVPLDSTYISPKHISLAGEKNNSWMPVYFNLCPPLKR
jgi:hypothetical protein